MDRAKQYDLADKIFEKNFGWRWTERSEEKGLINMKFAKGLLVGGLITTGLIMMYNDTNMMNKNKMMKKGKQFAKKIGIM